MNRLDTRRAIAAEALGTALLLAIVVGSGIMGQRLSGGDDAIALLANAIATGAGLVVLITIFAPVSGAHFNPLVTLALAARRAIAPLTAAGFMVAQFAGAVAGVIAAHAMFGLPLLQVSARLRDAPGQGVSEAIAAFGLLLTILGVSAARPAAVPAAVGLYVTAAYWFTASTAFANPAVTVARSLTDTFSGISPASIPAFVAAQAAGALAAVATAGWLFALPRSQPD
ncbi:MAG: aquaporin [Pseudomonadota bacterium]